MGLFRLCLGDEFIPVNDEALVHGLADFFQLIPGFNLKCQFAAIHRCLFRTRADPHPDRRGGRIGFDNGDADFSIEAGHEIIHEVVSQVFGISVRLYPSN